MYFRRKSKLYDMSWKLRYSSSEFFYHDVQSICRLLLDGRVLPEWNPAISTVEESDTTGTFVISVHRLLRGILVYGHSDLHTINMSITVPGLTEETSFRLSPQSQGTQVTHTIVQRGFLVALIGAAENSNVPAKRLARLACYLENSADETNESFG